MQRRTFLRTGAGVAGSLVIAGCSGDSDSTGGDERSRNTGGDTAQNRDRSVLNGNRSDDTGEDRTSPGTRWYDSDTQIGVLSAPAVETDRVGNMYVRGTAENFGDSDYSHVRLRFTFYSAGGAPLTDALANRSGLAAGEQWRFEAVAPIADEAETYALTETAAE